MRNLSRSPDYLFGRILTTDDGAVATNSEDWGWNLHPYETALFQIIPVQTPADAQRLLDGTVDASTLVGTPTSNPVSEAYYYNRATKLWCKHNPAQSFTAAGAGIATEIAVPAYGRRLGLRITGVTVGQAVLVYAAGYGRQEME